MQVPIGQNVDNQPDPSGPPLHPKTTLFRGPPAYAPRTPWPPWRAIAGAVAVIGLSIAASLALITLFEGGSVSNFPGG